MKSFAFILFLAMFFAETIFSQTGNLNRNLLPLGDQEAFSSNTGTARRGSSGGVYYNPAVISFIPNSQISVSGSTYMKFDHRLDSIPGPDNTQSNYSLKGFNAVPTTVVSVFAKGNTVGAISVIVPDNLNYSSFTTLRTENTTLFQVTSMKNSELWIGLSGGYKFNNNLSIGSGVHLINYEVLLNDTMLTMKGGYPARESSPKIAEINLMNFHVSTGAFTMNSGIYYRLLNFIDFGFKLQSRSAQQWEKVEVLVYNLQYNQQGMTANGTAPANSRAHYRLPLDLSFGMGLTGERWKLLLDISRQSGHRFNAFPDFSNAPRIETENTFRYNLGTEFNFNENLVFLGGVLYNPSSIHSLDGKTVGSREDYTGINFGAYMKGKNTRTGLGFFYYKSDGEQICGDSFEVAFNYNAKCTIHTRAFGLVLSTGFVF